MSFRVKTELRYGHISMCINCNELDTKSSDNAIEEIKCIAKIVKPECFDCGLINPNSRSKLIPNT